MDKTAPLGGSGGGALSLVSLDTLTVSGSLPLNGDRGGNGGNFGGAGGRIAFYQDLLPKGGSTSVIGGVDDSDGSTPRTPLE